jgi:LysM repeat protein
MTHLKSLVLCLGLQFVSQVQASPQAVETPREVNYSYSGFPTPRGTGTPREFQYSYDGFPPPRATGTPRGAQYNYGGIPPRGTGNPRQFQYNYDGFPPQATGTGAGINTSYRGPFTSRPGETNAPYPLSSVTDGYGSPRVTNSMSKAVVLQTTGTSPAAVSSAFALQSRASDGFPLDGATKTSIETVTLVPTPYIRPSGWVTKRSTTVSSARDLKISTKVSAPATQTQTAQPISTPSRSAICESGKTYTVVSNDTCEKIAIKEKVSTGQLTLLIQPPSTCNDLQIGQTLCLPKPCKLYKVQPGDFCFKITTKFNVELSDLYAANP